MFRNTSNRVVSTLWKQYHLYSAFQRIVRLSNDTTLGYEALLRGKTGDGNDVQPQILFAKFASERELLFQVDFVSRRLAIQNAAEFISDQFLFLNCHFASIQKGKLFDDIDKLNVPLSQIVIEIHETTELKHLDCMQKQLEILRSYGMKIALDDFGAGYSNFGIIQTLSPDFIKLDKSLISQIDTDPKAQKIVQGLVHFSQTVNSSIIAEGIERETQKLILRELSVPYGQGFHLGTPVISTDLCL